MGMGMGGGGQVAKEGEMRMRQARDDAPCTSCMFKISRTGVQYMSKEA